MVRNWILCKQGHYPSPPACRQTDPAACRDVDLQHWERAEKVSAVNKSDGPSLDLTASLFALPWQTTYAVCSWGQLISYFLFQKIGSLDECWSKFSIPYVRYSWESFASLSLDYQHQMAPALDWLLLLAVLPHISWDDHGNGWCEFPETFVLTGSESQSPCTSQWQWEIATTLESAVVRCKAQQFCWGSWLEKLHVVLGDEASLSTQSPLQPARLLGWMNIIKDCACCEWQFRVVLSFAGIQGLCLPEWCAVWKQEFI